MRRRVTILLTTVAVIGLAAPAAMAIPYASGVTDLGAGDWSFVLNQDADNVVIFRFGDTTLYLGPLTKGTHTFNLGMGTDFEIWVVSQEAAGWTQISDDNSTQNQFYHPRGVTVDRWADILFDFGRIYVSEGEGGPTVAGRVTTEGIYILDAAHQDVTWQGNAGYDGSIAWTGWVSPHRVSINQTDPADPLLYIGDWSDDNSGIWAMDMTDPNAPFKLVLDNTGRDPNDPNRAGIVMENYGAGPGELHGSVPCGPWVEGEMLTDDLKMYTVDEDVRRGNVLQYDIGNPASWPYATAPTDRVADDPNYIRNGYMDLVRDEDGSWWIAQYRWDDTNAVPALSHWEDKANAPSWTSGDNTEDLDRGYGSLDIHDRHDWIVMGTVEAKIYVVDIDDPNAPVIRDTIIHPGNSVRDVAFDIASNIYAVSNSSETLRAYSPGGHWITVTGYDSASDTGSYQQICFADLNGDNAVGLSDLATLLAHYGTTSGASYYDGDMDLDGDVQLSDLAALLARYGKTCP